MALTAITVTYNNVDDIDALLTSVGDQVERIIVVDNASSDRTVEVVAAHPRVELVRNARNLGFARAVNVGLHLAGKDDVLVVNPDVICPAGSVAALAERSEALQGERIVAPLLRYGTGEVQESARAFPTVLRLLARRTWLGRTRAGRAARHTYLDRPEHPGPVDWAIGAVLFVPFGLRDAIGPMDPRFFLYCEDLEWCVRAWQAGFGVFYDPAIEMTHGYRRASKSTWRLNRRPTRAHWISMIRFTLRHPRLMLTGRLRASQGRRNTQMS